jgi:transposase
MLQLTPQSIIYIANEAIDFRKGIDGIAGYCKNTFNINPFSGALFLFYNNNKNAFKILFYDGQGFVLVAKRLSQGKFQHKHTDAKNTSNYYQICHRALHVLFNNGNIHDVNFSKNWRSI